MRRAISCAAAVGAALLVHAVTGRLLVDRDVVLALLLGAWVETAALVAVLLASRLFLYLLAPGWALYVAVTLVLERRAKRGDGP